MMATPRAPFRHIPIILNPASGPERPVLRLLNTAFQAAGVDWGIYLTQRAGDARRLAQQLAAAGEEMIAVYGGDGTLKEVVSVLARTPISLAILPGGTGNAVAYELGIPDDLALAAALLCDPGRHTVRAVDLGQIGDHLFLLRASLGLETELLRATPRELKDQLGKLAYPLTAIQQIGQLPFTNYQITLDGRTVGIQGVQCTIANSAQMGMAGLTLAQGVDMSDGWLDVIVLTQIDLAALASIATSNLLQEDLGAEVQHWRAREITVAAEPSQAVALGGEIIAQTPVSARILPGALNVIVPRAA